MRELLTSDDWFTLLCKPQGTVLLDPDGWDRRNFAYSWGEELITKQEFYDRLTNSTCQIKYLITKDNE